MTPKDIIKFMIGLDILYVKKIGATECVNQNFARIRMDSYNSLPIEKVMTFHNVTNSLRQFLVRINMTTTITYF